jgi:hypothetical protein
LLDQPIGGEQVIATLKNYWQRTVFPLTTRPQSAGNPISISVGKNIPYAKTAEEAGRTAHRQREPARA